MACNGLFKRFFSKEHDLEALQMYRVKLCMQMHAIQHYLLVYMSMFHEVFRSILITYRGTTRASQSWRSNSTRLSLKHKHERGKSYTMLQMDQN